MVWLFYTTYISGDLAHHEIFRTKVGGIRLDKQIFDSKIVIIFLAVSFKIY